MDKESELIEKLNQLTEIEPELMKLLFARHMLKPPKMHPSSIDIGKVICSLFGCDPHLIGFYTSNTGTDIDLKFFHAGDNRARANFKQTDGNDT